MSTAWRHGRIVVFGASGRTGRRLVSDALVRGLQVTAFVRSAARLSLRGDALRVVEGDVADASRVAEAVAGSEAVLSALGVARPLRHDPAVVAGIGHIVEAMQAKGVRRLVYLSTLGIGDGREAAGFVLRWIAPIPLHAEFADHVAKEALVTQSSLDWTEARTSARRRCCRCSRAPTWPPRCSR